MHWTAGIHHDGSALYVSNPAPAGGEVVTIRLRTPRDAPVTAVFLRTAPDGEIHYEPMTITERDEVAVWWAADLPLTMPRVDYRFKIMSEAGAYFYNALGSSRADSPDFYDFTLLADFDGPDWVRDAVFYQIFPDRFYNGDPSLTVPEGAWERRGFKTSRRDWDEPPLPWKVGGNVDFFGGDLPGIVQKLDYLVDLGVNALYLNPIFSSDSNHRYDIKDFDTVDPHLGGNAALAELRRALDRRGMRLLLDITPNHCSWKHPWLAAAQADPESPTASYFTFNDHPDDYVTWMGVRTLAKLNYRSEALREAMYRAPESALRRWLAEPYHIDGWRLDVLNMTARQGMSQLGHEVMRELRAAVKADNPAAYLLGEHFFDGSPYLQGDQMDATMNYQGFTYPVRRWLAGDDLGAAWDNPYADPLPLPAEHMAQQWRRFMAAIPWALARQQFNLLGSHDIDRILTACGEDRALVRLAAVLLLTFPGVPSIYYGDEIGMDGEGDPHNRRAMVWDETAWDHDLRALHQRLIRLRRESDALVRGGFQLLDADGGLVAYQRQSRAERLVVIGYRGPEPLQTVTLPVWHGGLADGVTLDDALGGGSFTVADGALALNGLARGDALLLVER